MPALNSLVYLLIYLVIGGLVIYVVQWILGMIEMPQPVRAAILVLIALIVVIWLLNQFAPGLFG